MSAVRRPTLVWDIGNVLLDWSPDHLYRRLIPDDDARAAFYARLPLDAMNLDGDRGRLQPVVEDLAARHPEDAALILPWWGAWEKMCGGLLAESLAIRDAARAAGHAVWSVTNFASDSWDRCLSLYPELNAFDGVIVSGREGVVKPDPAIFELVERRSGMAPENLFLIDDRDANVASARARGWGGHVFEGVEGLKCALADEGLYF